MDNFDQVKLIAQEAQSEIDAVLKGTKHAASIRIRFRELSAQELLDQGLLEFRGTQVRTTELGQARPLN